jgi:glycosyltransferase involved in cell wall biosynthesis
MFDSKGHDLVIEAMALAPSIRVVFVGGDILGARFDELMELARVKGVSDRLTVTGYLPDEEYAQQLAAADLGVCAFGPNKSASGWLPALIAADCPIRASAIPRGSGVQRHRAWVGSHIRPFDAKGFLRSASRSS